MLRRPPARLTGAIGCALCALAVALVATGCDDAPATKLRINVDGSAVFGGEYWLECEPPGGTLPDPEAVCANLAERADAVRRPRPCNGAQWSWWHVEIRGRLEGRPIDVGLDTCWSPQTEFIDVLFGRGMPPGVNLARWAEDDHHAWLWSPVSPPG